MKLISEDYLMHHGVKGMKWGVRKSPERSAKREYRLNTYKNTLSNKAQKKSSKGKSRASDLRKEYKDLEKNGMRSESWTNEMKDRGEYYINNHGLLLGSLETIFEGNSQHEFNTYKTSVKKNMNYWNSYSKKWTQRNKNLMDMPISQFTTKKDIKRVYRGR